MVNVVMQRNLAAHAEHLGVLQAMQAAAPDAAALLTGPLSRSQLLQDGLMARFEQDFQLGTRQVSVLNCTVFRRNLQSVVDFLQCTALADREQLAQLLTPLQDRLTLHFRRSSCDPAWLSEVKD